MDLQLRAMTRWGVPVLFKKVKSWSVFLGIQPTKHEVRRQWNRESWRLTRRNWCLFLRFLLQLLELIAKSQLPSLSGVAQKNYMNILEKVVQKGKPHHASSLCASALIIWISDCLISLSGPGFLCFFFHHHPLPFFSYLCVKSFYILYSTFLFCIKLTQTALKQNWVTQPYLQALNTRMAA